MSEANVPKDGESQTSKASIASGFDRLVDKSFGAIDRIDYQNAILAFFAEYIDLILDDWMDLRTALIFESFESETADGTESATDLDAVEALDDAGVTGIDRMFEDVREGLHGCRSAFRADDTAGREARLLALRGTMRDLKAKIYDLKKLNNIQLRRFSRAVYRAAAKSGR